MVSKMFRGKEIILEAKNNPERKIVRTQTYAEVLDHILDKYYSSKWFEFNGGQWIMHRSNRDKNIKMISGKEILQGARNIPATLCLRTNYCTRTYKQVYEEILAAFVERQAFYHRGKGYWCMYDEKKDAEKTTNLKKQDYLHPNSLFNKDANGKPIPTMYKAGTVGETRWNPKRDGTGFGDLANRHMGDGNDRSDRKRHVQGRV